MTVSLAALAAAGPPPQIKGPPCSVRVLLDGLEPTEADVLRMLLAPGSGWDHEQIAAAVRESGATPSPQGQTIARHRGGRCRCDAR